MLYGSAKSLLERDILNMRRLLVLAVACVSAVALAGCGSAPKTAPSHASSTGKAAAAKGGICPGAPSAGSTQPATTTLGPVVVNVYWNGRTGCVFAKVSTDGGGTYTPHLVARDATGGDGIARAQIQFLDASSGWILVEGQPGAGQATWALFGTRDGGTTWARLAATGTTPTFPTGNVALAWTFTSAEDGWIVDVNANASPQKVFVYRTTDGGSSWTAASFALPAGASGRAVPTTPIFSTRTNASLEITVDNPQTGATDTYLYTTTDTGTSWDLATSLSGQD